MEPILKPRFKRFKNKMRLPELGRPPKSDYKSKNTTTGKIISLLSEGYGDGKEIRRLIGGKLSGINVLIKRLAPLYYNTDHEQSDYIIPKLLYPDFTYRSAELAIFPIQGDTAQDLVAEPYFEKVMSILGDKMMVGFEGACDSPIEIDCKECWVKFSCGLYLEFSFARGPWENFAKLSGYYHQDVYYQLEKPYQLPAIFPVIAQRIGTRTEGVTIDEIVKMESRERVKEQLSYVVAYLNEDKPVLQIRPYDDTPEKNMPSDWIIEGVETNHYFLIESLNSEEIEELMKELVDGFSITCSSIV